MDMSLLNIWAILVATLSTFVVGWLWYGPLFGKSWMAATGLTEEQLQQGNMAKIFGLAFVFELIILTGFGWVFFALAVNSLYEQKSWKYIFINGGYWTVAFTVMGLIIGAWK